MIIYNPKTKTTKSMFIDEYIKWLKTQCDSIMFYHSRDTNYPVSVLMYTKNNKTGERFVKMSQSEVDALNGMLPQMRKDRSFNISKIKV
jgi:hypothetical protein